MAEGDPLLLGYLLDQILFDFHGILVGSQAEPAAEPCHVRVDHHAGRNSIRRAQDHVGRLPANSRQGDQRIQVPWNLAAVLFEQLLATALNALGLVAEEARALNVLLQVAQAGRGKVANESLFEE